MQNLLLIAEKDAEDDAAGNLDVAYPKELEDEGVIFLRRKHRRNLRVSEERKNRKIRLGNSCNFIADVFGLGPVLGQAKYFVGWAHCVLYCFLLINNNIVN